MPDNRISHPKIRCIAMMGTRHHFLFSLRKPQMVAQETATGLSRCFIGASIRFKDG